MVPSSSFEPNTHNAVPSSSIRTLLLDPRWIITPSSLVLGLIVSSSSTCVDCRVYSSSADVAATAPSQDAVPSSFKVRLGDGYILLYLQILGRRLSQLAILMLCICYIAFVVLPLPFSCCCIVLALLRCRLFMRRPHLCRRLAAYRLTALWFCCCCHSAIVLSLLFPC